MKKVVWALVMASVISFLIWSKNPLDEVANFIIGGEVPGTKLVLSFWPSIGLATITLWLVKRWVKSLRVQMLSHTAQEINSEKAQAEFKEAHDSNEFNHKNRAVIAAPQSVESSSLF